MRYLDVVLSFLSYSTGFGTKRGHEVQHRNHRAYNEALLELKKFKIMGKQVILVLLDVHILLHAGFGGPKEPPK